MIVTIGQQNKSDQGCKQLPIRFTQLWPFNLQVLTWSTRQVLVLLCMSVLVEDLPSELFKEHSLARNSNIIGFRMLQSAPEIEIGSALVIFGIRWPLPCLPRTAHLWELVSEASLEVGSRQTWDVTAEAKTPKWHENTMSHDVTWCHMMSHDVTWCHMMSHDVTWCHHVIYKFLAVSHDLKFNLFSDRISSFAVRWCMVYRVIPEQVMPLPLLSRRNSRSPKRIASTSEISRNKNLKMWTILDSVGSEIPHKQLLYKES